jgi:hypothetical protein
MGIINNKWLQAVIVLVIANFFTPLGDSAVGAVGVIGMLIVFVPKFREMAKLDNIVSVKKAPNKNKTKISTENEEGLSTDNLDSNDESNASWGSQDAWLAASNELWGGGEHRYPDWITEANENCTEEAWEYFTSIEDKVENDEAFAKKIEQEFDLSAYEKFRPKETDWIDNAINAYINRAQSMPNFEKKYRK